MKDRMLSDILNVPGNDRCCDCTAENPEWASINLGITLCIGQSLNTLYIYLLVCNDCRYSILIIYLQLAQVYIEV